MSYNQIAENQGIKTTTTRTTLVQQKIAIIENQTNESNFPKQQQQQPNSLTSDSLVSHLISPQDGAQRFGIYHKHNSGSTFTNPPTPAVETVNPMMQPRNRFGMILSQQSGHIDDVHLQNLSAVTPTSCHNGSGGNKQGSPFYAEPADALSNANGIANIIKRAQRNVSVPKSQRFSEPPKGPVVALRHLRGEENGALEKSQLSGSLDELKRKNRQARGRLDPWPLDSSWEFMGNENGSDEKENQEEEEYDSDLNWRSGSERAMKKNRNNVGEGKVIEIRNGIPIIDAVPKRPLTVNQIIARKLPELNVLDLSPTIEEGSSRNGTMKGKRTSAYDNLERNNGNGYGFAGSFLLVDGSAASAASDDGTMFSEPWESSRWDTMRNSADELSDTIHFSKCKPACLSADDDTLMEENSQVQLRSKTATSGSGKVATILRSRSIRDREVLCEY